MPILHIRSSKLWSRSALQSCMEWCSVDVSMMPMWPMHSSWISMNHFIVLDILVELPYGSEAF